MSMDEKEVLDKYVFVAKWYWFQPIKRKKDIHTKSGNEQ